MQLERRQFIVGLGAGLALFPDFSWAKDGAINAPIRLAGGRVLMDCTFGSRGPFPFVIDTGGVVGLIRNDLVKLLGLRKIGDHRFNLRQGRKSYSVYQADNVVLGGVLPQSVASFIGVDGIFRDNQAGSLAAGIVSELPSELALAEGAWRIWPDGAPDRSGWAAFSDAIREAENPLGSPHLFADISINGTAVRVGLDTGMPESTYIYRNAAEQAGIWHASKWAPAPPNGTGRVVRASLTMAGRTTSDALITLVEEPEWQPFQNGIVGLGILRQFDIATEPKSQTVYLKPNGIGPSTRRYNRFGAWIDTDGDKIRLGTVGPGSPAAEAGLKRGDRIIGSTFDELLAQIYAPAGTVMPLTVDQGRGKIEIEVRLSDYL